MATRRHLSKSQFPSNQGFVRKYLTTIFPDISATFSSKWWLWQNPCIEWSKPWRQIDGWPKLLSLLPLTTSNSSNRALVCKQRIWLNIVKQNMIAYLLHILNTNSYPKLEVSVWDNISRTHCEDNANFLKLLLLKDEHLPLLNVQAASLPNIFTDFLRPSICHHLPSMLAVLQSEKPQNR